MASLCANGRGVLFTMLISKDGIVIKTKQLLSLNFNFGVGTVYADDEFLDASGQVSESVFQMQTNIDDGVVWKLRSGTFRVFRLSNS